MRQRKSFTVLFEIIISKNLHKQIKLPCKGFASVLLLLTFTLASPKSAGMPVQGPDASDISSLTIVLFDFVQAKQWSLPPTGFLSPPVNQNYPLFGELSAVGFYSRGFGYKFRQRLLVVNLNENSLELLPRHVRQSITPRVHQFADISEILMREGVTCHICAVITGKGSHHEDESMVGKEFNLSFHGFAAKHSHPESREVVQFLPAGIFVPLGITAASNHTIDMGKIGNILVLCERPQGPLLLGPNTAKFKTTSEISSFWSIAKMGNLGEYIIVTYHLLLNSTRTSDAVKAALNTHNWSELITSIKQVPERLNLDKFSSYVLYDWVENIAHASRPFIAQNSNEIADCDDRKDDQ